MIKTNDLLELDFVVEQELVPDMAEEQELVSDMVEEQE